MAAYPFNTYTEKLIDNYLQARGYLMRMERRLDRTGRTEEFKKQFRDNIDRGVFRHLPQWISEHIGAPQLHQHGTGI
jgi:uncharacterized protein YbcI